MRHTIFLLTISALFAPQWALAQSANSNVAAQSVPGELLVQFRTGVGPVEKARALGRANASVLEEVLPGSRRQDGKGDLVLVRHQPQVPAATARQALLSDQAVEFVEPNWIYTHTATSNDTYFMNGSLWGMYGPTTSPANQYGSNAAAAWAAGFTGSTAVYVGVIDEGIQFDHPDLNTQVWVNPFDPPDGIDNDGNGYVDDVHGWDFDGKDNTIYDGGPKGNLDDHGTHVSGTIAGRGGNGVGVAGVNWSATLISGKFLGRRGGTTANAVKAIDYFNDLKTRHGLNIVATNNSWGGGGYSQALYDAINRANQVGILFVAAAGNGGVDGVGDNNDTAPSYPASYNSPNIIAVAAITSSGTKASYSNYGATSVDIGAPGSGIISTTAFDTYASYNGTSMATPHVTGAAALYAAVTGLFPTTPADAAKVKNAILSSAVPIASLKDKCVTGGILNVFAALSK